MNTMSNIDSEYYKVACLGDRDSVLGFRALGINTYFADTPEEAAPILKELASQDVAVIYITEQLALGLSAEIQACEETLTPAVILIPGKQGTLGLGQAALKSAVERAVGADIL